MRTSLEVEERLNRLRIAHEFSDKYEERSIRLFIGTMELLWVLHPEIDKKSLYEYTRQFLALEK
jgi:hypothetical protein